MNRTRMGLLCVLAGAFVLGTHALGAPTVYPTGVTIHEEGVEDGYVLFAAQDGRVHLIDLDGVEVHSWSLPCDFSYAQEALPGGTFLTKACNNLVELDWNSSIVWEYEPPPSTGIHHDWERLDNGNTLIVMSQRTVEPSISSEEIVDDFIVEVSPAGEVLWEFHLSDHFDELGFTQARIDLIGEQGGNWSRVTSVSTIPANTNHVDFPYIPGNVIIGLANQNTLAIIDRDSDAIVWTRHDQIVGPYSSYMIPGDLPGADHILTFDSGWAENFVPVESPWQINNRDHSKIRQIWPQGGIPWVYDAPFLRPFFSPTDGGAERLANGNTFITEGRFGRVFEVTDAEEIVWEYVSPITGADGNAIDRADKVPLDWASPFLASEPAVVEDAAAGSER